MEERSVSSDASAPDGHPAPASDVLTAIEGAAAVVTLNRPRALNALTTAMRAQIAEAVPRWARDPQVYALLVTSACNRAFCAGGDLREMIDWGKTRPVDARRSLAAEYSLNWALDCFNKPTVSLIDGVVMGSGVGISLYGTHRVAGERYRFAMPETLIGLFPDDGVSWAFARMPREIGTYLALTGRSVERADAYRLRLVTHCIRAERFAEIRAAISDADPVDPVLDGRHEDPGPGELAAFEGAIERCFSADAVEDIVARLQAERGALQAWAEGVLNDLSQRSPTSLKVALRHVREARGLDLRATLVQDFRIACRFLEAPDLYEGVRASLIDRDQSPRWRPDRLHDVTPMMVDRYFAPLGPDDLQLSSRAEMQSVRT